MHVLSQSILIQVIISDESESHNRFEIPKCKIIITTSSSINKRMILDLEYVEILKYKTDYHSSKNPL